MRRRRAGIAALALVAALTPVASRAALHPPVRLPVLAPETPAGTRFVSPAADQPPTTKVVDGLIGDWVGPSPGFAGAVVADHGELVYQDHVFDAYGADDGRDAKRLESLDALARALPQTYRIDALEGADPAGEFGIDLPQNPTTASDRYGDLPMTAEADLQELRLAATDSTVYVLARTTTLTTTDRTALLVLAGLEPGGDDHAVPFVAGLRSTARVAFVFAGSSGRVADLATGEVRSLPAGSVVTNPSSWTNAIEAAIPRHLLGSSSRVAAATGTFDDAGALTLANVAFRGDEPVRVHFDKRQALALYRNSIDSFTTVVDLAALARGETQRFRVGPGYHERVFRSADAISREAGNDGIYQPYGVYIPHAYDPYVKTPLTFWLHWRGGDAHSAATQTPRVMQEFGEDRNDIVVSPHGRGSSSWYVGRGMADILEVRADVFRMFAIDDDHVYVTGHSMGGWGSYLLATTHPDWFAAAAPVSPPVTQGAFTGLDFPGCDDFAFEEYTPCYIQANDGDPRVENTLKLLDNLRNTPIAIFAGGIDELVPISGQVVQALRFRALGYPYRFYVFPSYEHYTPPVVDEWAEFGRFFDDHTIDRHPARVTYVRDMPFERAVEDGPNVSEPWGGLQFDLDHAWWMSELTPADPVNGRARFDGQSLAMPSRPTVTLPIAGGPTALGQAGPFTMTGLTTRPNPAAAAPPSANGFTATLTGTSAVRLDLDAMNVRTDQPIVATVRADHPLHLRLDAGWSSVPIVTVDGNRLGASAAGRTLELVVPVGSHQLRIG